ncbi:hypothetical protein Fcan01_00539 [Folsomia candida]|uniref:Uncharacterized protein n=1 Tax=Folsomia candida TaxID=158441 RepID=A0A226F0L6_FOLCA|nr:hypothetical protein Fcan01_00539 [Folsomia candida]
MAEKFCGLASLLIRYLKAGDIFKCIYTTWDGNLVNFQAFIDTVDSTVADTVEAVVLVDACFICLCCRFEFTADPLTGQLFDYFIHWPEMQKRPGQKMDISITCVRYILTLSEILVVLFATLIATLNLFLPCKPPCISSHFCENGVSSTKLQTRLVFFLADGINCIWYLFGGAYYGGIILCCCISYQFVRYKSLIKIQMKGSCKIRVKLYRELQIENKIINAAIRGRIFLAFAYLEPVTEILLALGVMMVYNSNGHIFRLVTFLIGYAAVILVCLMIFTIAGKLNKDSINWVERCTARSPWERRVVQSLAPLRVKFGNNFVERLTPLIVQEFCIRQVASTLILMRLSVVYMNSTITRVTCERLTQFAPNLAYTFSKVLATHVPRLKSPPSKMGPKIDPKVEASVKALSKANLSVRGKRRQSIASGQGIARNACPSKKKNSATLKKIDRLTDKENPPSQRQIAKQCQISKSYVNTIIHRDLCKTVLRKAKLHALKPSHIANRKTNSRKLYEGHLAGKKSEFVVTLDEALFFVQDCNRTRTICYTKDRNRVSHYVCQKKEKFSDRFMVVGAMTGRGFLEVEIPKKYPGELDKVFIHHDAASSHTAKFTQQYAQDLKRRTGMTLISNSEIPIKSPDTSPMDFFGFGYLKQQLFKRKASTMAGVWKVLNEEWDLVSPEMCEKVFGSWKRRLRLVAQKHGEHMENTKAIHSHRVQKL